MPHQSSQFELISLPPVVLAELYSHSLVIIDKVFSPNIDSPAVPYDLILDDQSIESASTKGPGEIVENISINKLPLNRLGDFKRQVLVLVDDKNSLHLADAELELLGKMLQAIKLSFADIAIVNVANQACTWEIILHQLPAKQVIFFGVEPALVQMPVRFPNFRVQQWNGINFLFSPALADINQPSPNQVLLKKDLWKALQEMFSN